MNSRNDKPLVFVTGKIAQSALGNMAGLVQLRVRDQVVTASPAELLEGLKEAQGVVCFLDDKFNSAVMSACPRLKVIANIAVGYDNVDIKAATERGILVVNTPGVLDNATADLAFGLLLSASRRITEGDRLIRAKAWTGWSTDFMLGHDLSQMTLGIVGMGRIGEAVARRARAFDMKLIYTRRGHPEKDARLEKELSARRVELDELLSKADFISIHCPLNEETRNLIGAPQFALMKKSAILVNTARGAIIDEGALLTALKDGRIAGAGLDVFSSEPHVPSLLMEMENVVLTPHIGSATHETRQAMAELAVSGLLQAFSHQLPDNAVNKEAWRRFLSAHQGSATGMSS